MEPKFLPTPVIINDLAAVEIKTVGAQPGLRQLPAAVEIGLTIKRTRHPGKILPANRPKSIILNPARIRPRRSKAQIPLKRTQPPNRIIIIKFLPREKQKFVLQFLDTALDKQQEQRSEKPSRLFSNVFILEVEACAVSSR